MDGEWTMTNLKPRLKEEVQVYQLRRNDLIYINSILYKIVDVRSLSTVFSSRSLPSRKMQLTIAEWENQTIKRIAEASSADLITRYCWQDIKKRKHYGNRR